MGGRGKYFQPGIGQPGNFEKVDRVDRQIKIEGIENENRAISKTNVTVPIIEVNTVIAPSKISTSRSIPPSV